MFSKKQTLSVFTLLSLTTFSGYGSGSPAASMVYSPYPKADSPLSFGMLVRMIPFSDTLSMHLPPHSETPMEASVTPSTQSPSTPSSFFPLDLLPIPLRASEAAREKSPSTSEPPTPPEAGIPSLEKKKHSRPNQRTRHIYW